MIGPEQDQGGLREKLMGGLGSLGGKVRGGLQQLGQGMQGNGSDTQKMMRMMMLQNALQSNPGSFGQGLMNMLPFILMGMGGKAPVSGTTGFGAEQGGGLPPGSLLNQQNLQQQMHQGMPPQMLAALQQQQQGGVQ